MKKFVKYVFILALALCSLSFTGIVESSSAKIKTEQYNQQEMVVYITRTGEKYHRLGCHHLSRSKIPISLKDAKKNRYTPCKVCCPPS
jgi:hypothetical protein